jgi:hypothetical protein
MSPADVFERLRSALDRRYLQKSAGKLWVRDLLDKALNEA